MRGLGAPYAQLRPTDERAALEQFLDFYRSEVVELVGGLSDEVAAERLLPATDMTIGGIVKHLAWSEDSWFQGKLLGSAVPEPWLSAPLSDQPDWPFQSARGEPLEDLVALYTAACDRSRRATSEVGSLGDLSARPSNLGSGSVNLRWLLLHMIDETARHAGHLDLLLDATESLEP